jgi:hypothetical protein
MQTEAHVYARAVAASVLLALYPFLMVMLSKLAPAGGPKAIAHKRAAPITPMGEPPPATSQFQFGCTAPDLLHLL